MSLYDLTTVAAVNAWLGQDPATDAAILQQAVTGYSRYVLTRTGRSYLSGFRNYTERYNGNGSQRLMLRNYPVLSVASLTIGSQTIPPSPDYVQPGWAIDTSGSHCAVVLIGAGQPGFAWTAQTPWSEGNGVSLARGGPYRFDEGLQNIGITYTAGTLLTANGEEQTVPATAPYTVTATNATTFYADLGATASNGVSLAGQYSVANGIYTFNVSLAGATVLLNYQYGGVPEDLTQAVTEIVAENYRRRGWIGQSSQNQPGVGTTAFRSWEISPTNEMVLTRYERKFTD